MRPVLSPQTIAYLNLQSIDPLTGAMPGLMGIGYESNCESDTRLSSSPVHLLKHTDIMQTAILESGSMSMEGI